MIKLNGKVSIIMPAFNEAAHIASSIKETTKAFNDFGCPWELLVIDDGSSDNTFSIVQEFSRQDHEHIILKRNSANSGKGHAIKNSLNYLSGDYVVFLDADMDLHPAQIEVLFNIMFLNNADVVIGSKMHPNSVVRYPALRKIISFAYYLLVKLLFGLSCHDTQTGLKLFKADVLKNIFPRILVKEFAFDLEVLVNAYNLGYTIVEAPIELNPQRKFGRIGLKAIYTTTRDTLAVFYRMRILKYYDRIDRHSR